MGRSEEHRERVLAMLRMHRQLRVGEVVESLGLSEATVRRLFSSLERSGELLRVHGGVRLPPAAGLRQDYSFQREAGQQVAEKHAIGVAAANRLVDGDKIFLDSGTTPLECGLALMARLRSGTLRELTVVTNSLAYSDSLARVSAVTLTGGRVRPERQDLCGIPAFESIAKYHFSAAVLGADGIDDEGVLYSTDEDTAQLARTVVEHSDRVYILAASRKLGQPSFVSYGRLRGRCHTLVTDRGVPREMLAAWRRRGVDVLVVDEDDDDDVGSSHRDLKSPET